MFILQCLVLAFCKHIFKVNVDTVLNIIGSITCYIGQLVPFILYENLYVVSTWIFSHQSQHFPIFRMMEEVFLSVTYIVGVTSGKMLTLN